MGLSSRLITHDNGLPYGIEIRVHGMAPATKGSYRAVTGRSRSRPGTMVTRLIPDNKNEHSWRAMICEAIRSLKAPIPVVGREYCISVLEEYHLVRPKSVSLRQRLYPSVKPDIDKLARATHDALTDSGLIADDSMITSMTAKKDYVGSLDEAGVDLTVYWHPNTTKKENEVVNALRERNV